MMDTVNVKLRTGKHKGMTGYLIHKVESHHLSSDKVRWAVRIMPFPGNHRTVLVNECNLELVGG